MSTYKYCKTRSNEEAVVFFNDVYAYAYKTTNHGICHPNGPPTKFFNRIYEFTILVDKGL